MTRLEHKFLVPNLLLHQLRRRVEPFVRPNLHAVKGLDTQTVRNIHLDRCSHGSAGASTCPAPGRGMRTRRSI